MSKSILQKRTGKYERECFLCRLEADKEGYYGELTHSGLQKHHVFGGHRFRKIAEHYGLWCYLCDSHHEHGEKAVHINAEISFDLKQRAQKVFEEIYSHDEWMEIIGKNYL